jgi:hypothetical protein
VTTESNEPTRAGIVAGYIIFGLPALALLIFLTITAAPLVLTVVAWVLLYRLVVRNDVPPYTYGRFAFALLIAWAVEGFLFKVAVGAVPGLYRHFVPAIVVVSAFVGFFAWQELPQKPVTHEQWFMRQKLIAKAKAAGTRGNPLIVTSHPFALYLSLLLAVFTMTYAVMPVLTTFFPAYGSYWTDWLPATSDKSDS